MKTIKLALLDFATSKHGSLMIGMGCSALFYVVLSYVW